MSDRVVSVPRQGRFWGTAMLLVGAASALAAQSTPATAVVTVWDLFAATGGNGTATQNVASIALDAVGAAGPAASVWVASQNPLPRLGRLDPSAAAGNYVEWRPVSDAEGGGPPLGLTVNRGNGDVWMSIQGDPSFVAKLGGTNTFRKFRSTYPLVPHGIATAADHSAIAALPLRNASGIGNAIIQVPRNPSGGSVTATVWMVGGEPREVAIDSTGRIWFTQSAANRLGRLDPANGSVLEWTLPAGSSPAGLRLSGSAIVCVASSGGVADLTGVEHCLDPATNQFTQYARAAGDGFDSPQQVAINSDAETFITEQSGNSISFVAFAARASAPVFTVTPALRSVTPKTTKLYVSDTTVAPSTLTAGATETTITGVDNGSGIVRFTLPPVPLTYPFAHDGYPQPVSITPVFDDQGRGTGKVYFGEYFDGPLWGRAPAGRLARLALATAPAVTPVIQVNPDSLRFDAISGQPSPAAQAIAIAEASSLPLSWTATKAAAWLTLGSVSGAAPGSLPVSVNHASLAAGSYTDTITIDDGGGGADPRTITVTLNVTNAPTISVSPASLTFAATSGSNPPPSQTFAVSNVGGGTLNWTATASQPWINVLPKQGTAPSAVTVAVDTTSLSGGVSTGTVTISAPGSTNTSQTVSITVNVSSSGPAISLSPAAMTFTATKGSPAPAAQSLTVSNTGGGTLAWTATSSQPWLTASPTSGSATGGGSSTTSVAADHSALARGTYTGTISVLDVNASNSPQTLPVTLVVTAPTISISPSSINVTAARGGPNPPAQTITIGNTGDATLNYTAAVTSSTPWLTIASGGSGAVVPSSSAILELGISIDSLTRGVHTGTVQVSDPSATNTPLTISVSVTITAPTIALSPSSLSFSVLRGRTPGSQSITVSNTGDAPLNFSAAAATSGGGTWLAVSPASGTVAAGSSTTLTATVSSSALASGSYSGSITISDANASNNPQSAAVTLTVAAAPTIALSPAAVAWTAVKDGTNPSSQSITLANTGDATLEYAATITTSSPWLTIASGASGTVAPSGTGTLVLAADTTGLAKGTYAASVQVADPNATNTPVTIAVTLTVTAPVIGLGSSALTFSALRGRDPSPQGLTVTNSGDAPLTFAASTATNAGGSWLAVSPASGTLAPGDSTTLAVTITSNALSSGTYAGSIAVSDAGAANSPQSASVSLTIDPAPTISLGNTSLSFTAMQGTNPAGQTFTVTNTGDATLTFTPAIATWSGGAWLNVAPSGAQSVAPGDTATFTVTAAASSLAAGSYSGTVTVSDANATNGPQTATASLTISAAAVIALDTNTLTFAATRGGGDPANQVVTLGNTGGATLDYTATVTSGESWLSLAPASGSVGAGGSTPLIVAVTASALTVGANVGTVTIVDPAAGNSPQTITVTATLTAPEIAVTPASVSLTALRGRNPAPQAITLTNSGTAPLAFTSAANTVSGGAWLAVAPASGTVGAGASTTLTLTATTAALASGSYEGSITVTDPNATNGPQTVPVSLTVTPAPTIVIDTPALAFSANEGSSPPAQTFTVTNSGDAALSFTPAVSTSGGGSWLSVSPTGAQSVAAGETVTFTVSPNSASLSAGSYGGAVAISDASATNDPQTVAVSLTVGAAAVMALDQNSLAFSATSGGGNPSSQLLVLSNAGSATLNYSAGVTSGAAWLSISPATGSVGGGGSTSLTVSVNASALAVGSNTGTIQISDPSAANAPQTVTVTATLAAPAISLSPASLSFTALRSRNPPTQTVTVSNTGDAPLAFTAAASTTGGGNWLAVSPSSGTVAPGGSTTLTVTVTSAALASGSYDGAITLSDANAANSPQAATVSLTVSPAPSISLTPALTFSTLRGRDPASQTMTLTNVGDGPLNFSTVASTAGGGSWLAVSPASGTVAAGQSTTLTVNVTSAALASGAYSGSITIADANATNAPQAQSVSLTVSPAPAIGLGATAQSFTGVRFTTCNGVTNGTNPGGQTLTVSNTGDAPLTYAISSTASWLSASPADGTVGTGGSTTVTVSVDLNALPLGTHTGTLTIADPNASNTPQTVTVTLTVTEAPVRLCVVPATLALGNLARGATGTATVQVTNVGDGTAAWTAAFSAPSKHTVTVTPAGGGNGPTAITISVTPSNSNPKANFGSYSMTVTFTDAAGSTDTLTVTWTVV